MGRRAGGDSATSLVVPNMEPNGGAHTRQLTVNQIPTLTDLAPHHLSVVDLTVRVTEADAEITVEDRQCPFGVRHFVAGNDCQVLKHRLNACGVDGFLP